ncbi:MAG: tetratricopeptide repeat protein [Bacteroidia bacterium]
MPESGRNKTAAQKARTKHIFCILFFSFFFCGAHSQNFNVDSLKKTLDGPLADTVRVTTLDHIGHGLMRKGDLGEAKKYAEQALALATQINFKSGIGSAYNTLGNIYSGTSDSEHALDCLLKSLKIREELHDKKGIAASYNNIGIIYFNLSDFAKAIDYMQKALKIQEEFGNRYYMAACIGNIAVLYDKVGEDSLALCYQKRSLQIHRELGDKSDIVASLNHMGSLYRAKGKYEESKKYLYQALALTDTVNELMGKAETHGNIGHLYFDMGQYDNANKELEKGLAYAQELGDKKVQTEMLTVLGKVNVRSGRNANALAYYKTALTLSKETGSLEDEQGAATGMYEIYKAANNTKDALYYHEILTELKDSIFSSAKRSAFANLKIQFALDRQEHELKLKSDEELKKQEEEKNKQRFIGYIIIAVLIIVLIFSYFLFQRFRVTNSQKKIIEEQKILVEVKNKDITDSITYAKRIQDAILPAWEIKEKLFPDSFIILQPRDIVSGDFYWFSEKNGKRLIAAVDCTGHGVPGAFMSMTGNAFLNEIVNERGITQPGEILSELRHLVIRALKQTGAGGEQKDGMDISLLSISGNTASWAGANNPLWIIRNGEMIEYKPDKRPIGYFAGKGLPFSEHLIPLEKGDSIYLLTDGYADQFGGPKGKKFKYSQLKSLLLSIQDKTMKEQEAILMRTFIDWKGMLEQVDDVCIIGLRV